MLPDGDFTGSSMVDVIEDNTATADQGGPAWRSAAYLKSVAPVENDAAALKRCPAVTIIARNR